MLKHLTHARRPTHIFGHSGLVTVFGVVQMHTVAALRLGHVAGKIGV